AGDRGGDALEEDPELEVLVGIEPLRVDGKLCHEPFSWVPIPLDLDLAGDLLELDDHELGRLEWSEADDDVDDAEIDVVLRGGLLVTLHEVRVSWRAPLERPLAEEIVHEGAHVEPDLSPERLIVRLEDHPLCSPEQAFLDVQSQSPNRDVLVLIRQL